VERCLNCRAELTGPYCAQCGQRAQLRRLTIGALSHDALHDLVHLDSRVWRTLVALLLMPGKLTNEFIAGRRTVYLPPFRLYLVLSLVFFLLPSFGGNSNAVITDDEPTTSITSDEGRKAAQEAMQELKRSLGKDQPTAMGATGEPAKSPATSTAGKAVTPPTPTRANALLQDTDCSKVDTDLFGGRSGWLQPRLVQACEHLKTVSEREFGRALRNNIPKMMFIFLPLIALVNLVLYVFRRRTYVEHLLFYVHFHAFAFLLLTLQGVVTGLMGWVGHLSFASGLVTFAAYLYLFVYLFRAMRSVYYQSRTMTALKYFVVLTAYGVCLLITLAGTTLYTAFTL